MRWPKNPMVNAIYVALITAIYAAIFIVSSEFVMSYSNLLSESWWASFIISRNMKFVGVPVSRVAGCSRYAAAFRSHLAGARYNLRI